MRAQIVIDVEIEDGQRPGTRFARLEWVARSLARFAGFQRRVRRVHRVDVHPGDSTTLTAGVPLMTVTPDAAEVDA